MIIPLVETSPVEERIGIDRAFDVIRNHTVHTKGYVMTALKFIEEFGTLDDKAVLQDLLKEKSEAFASPAKTKKAPTRAQPTTSAPSSAGRSSSTVSATAAKKKKATKK